MPDLLALEFEPRKILGIDAQVSPSGVRIKSCFELTIPDELDLGDDSQAAGEWLKQQLAERGVHSTQVVTTFPREIAVVRHIELPDVPDEELPDLVKYQAGMKSSLPLDQLVLDFLPLPKQEGASARDVLLATIPRQALAEMTAVTAAADLHLKEAGLSPVSAAEVVLRSSTSAGEGSPEASIIITRHGPRVEISLLKGTHVVFSHFTQVAGEGTATDNQAVISAVARSLMGLTGPVRSGDIAQSWLLGSTDEFEALAPLLEKRLNPNVRILDPFETSGIKAAIELPKNRSAYAALVGSLLAQSNALAEPIDFLSPRKPPVKPDHTRRRAIIGGAIAACLAVAVGGTMYFKISELNQKIASLQTDQRNLDKLLTQSRPLLDHAELIEDWTADRTLWLDEFVALQAQLPPADRAYFDQAQFNLGTANARGKIELHGFSRERKDAIEFSQRIVRQDERYQLLANSHRPDEKEPFHPWKFDADLLLIQHAPAVQLTSTSPAESKTEPEQAPQKPSESIETPAAAAKPEDRPS